MKTPIIKIEYENEFKTFVTYWSKLYFYKLSEKYDTRISNKIYSPNDLKEFYIWKNGMILSKLKLKSFEDKILSKIEIINNFKLDVNFNIEEYLKEFKNVKFVWKIFLLHLIKPDKYPIYDQHIHRAYLYINKLNWINISEKIKDEEKSIFYFDSYLPFIEKEVKLKIKNIDEAMYTFGKFLNTENNRDILK